MKENSKKSDLICGIALVLFSLFPIAVQYPLASALLVAAAVSFTCFTLHHSRFMLGSLFTEIALVMLLGVYGASAVLSATLFAAISATYLSRGKSTRVLPAIIVPLSSLVGAAATYLATKSLVMAALPLVLLLPTTALVITIKKQTCRTQGIAIITLSLVLPAIAAAAIWIYMQNGAISFQIIGDTITSLREKLSSYLASLNYQDFIPIAESQNMLTKENAELLATMLFNNAIGIIIAALSVVAYLAQRFAFSFICAVDGEDAITTEMGLFRMSAVSGVVFVLAYTTNLITSFMSSENAALVSAVASNLYMILELGFVATGFVLFFSNRQKRTRRASPFTWFLIIALVFINPMVLPTLIAYYGAIRVIFDDLVSPMIKNRKS